MTKKLKVIVFVPTTHAEKIRKILRKVGAGKTKKYEGCSFSTFGLQRFYPRRGAVPFLGKIKKLELVEEERIETFILASLKDHLLSEILKVHPYEEPVIDFYEIESSYIPV